MGNINIYETRDKVRMIFMAVSVIMVAGFIYMSNSLMTSLAEEERSKMEIWAEATRQLAAEETDEVDMSLVLKVIQSNTTIPVIILDDKANLLWHHNMEIPSDTSEFIKARVEMLKEKNNVIEVVISDSVNQYLYYDDSVLLKRLSYYPYIQLSLLLLFILLGLFAFESTKRSEQNKVWVGLSKETAHQLGTPISSLMAWMDFLKADEKMDQSITEEMNKDVVRLKTIADRFSKIGSEPSLEISDLNQVTGNALSYMRKRVSSKMKIEFQSCARQISMPLCIPLFEWVIENLCKNAVDASSTSQGRIRVLIDETTEKVFIEIEDNGKGIAKKNFKTVFRPGFTTKKRGWGLGLTLVKRIIEEYHHGKIFVKESLPEKKTVFRIEFEKSRINCK